MSVDQTEIGRRIKDARRRKGKTQAQLAEGLGMDQALFNQYERGRIRINSGLLAGIAKALAVTADELLGLRPPKDRTKPLDQKLLRRMQKIQRLSPRARERVVKAIDSALRKETQ